MSYSRDSYGNSQHLVESGVFEAGPVVVSVDTMFKQQFVAESDHPLIPIHPTLLLTGK